MYDDNISLKNETKNFFFSRQKCVTVFKKIFSSVQKKLRRNNNIDIRMQIYDIVDKNTYESLVYDNL